MTASTEAVAGVARSDSHGFEHLRAALDSGRDQMHQAFSAGSGHRHLAGRRLAALRQSMRRLGDAAGGDAVKAYKQARCMFVQGAKSASPAMVYEAAFKRAAQGLIVAGFSAENSSAEWARQASDLSHAGAQP